MVVFFFFSGYHIRGGSSAVHIPADPPGHYVWAGFHGYDNSHPDMNCIFMAKGPSFKKHYKGPPIDLVDIYQVRRRLFRNLLGFTEFYWVLPDFIWFYSVFRGFIDVPSRVAQAAFLAGFFF